MNQREAEMINQVMRVIDDQGMWLTLCEHLKSQGFSGTEIVNTINMVSTSAGCSADLKPEDCQP